jgi:hypothetical protein
MVAGAVNALWVWHWDRDKSNLDEGKRLEGCTPAVKSPAAAHPVAVIYAPVPNRWISGCEDGSATIWEVP